MRLTLTRGRLDHVAEQARHGLRASIARASVARAPIRNPAIANASGQAHTRRRVPFCRVRTVSKARHPGAVTGHRTRSGIRLNLPAIADVSGVEVACHSIQAGGSHDKARDRKFDRHCDADRGSLRHDRGARLLAQQPQAIGPPAADHATRNPPAAYPCSVDQQPRGRRPRRPGYANSGPARTDISLVVRLFRREIAIGKTVVRSIARTTGRLPDSRFSSAVAMRARQQPDGVPLINRLAARRPGATIPA